MPRIRKKTSKRGTTHQRAKIKHKVSESRRKAKKAAKKNPQWKSKHSKDPGIPNSFPYKAEILAEIAAQRRQEEEERQKRKKQKKAERAAAKAVVEAGQVDETREVALDVPYDEEEEEVEEEEEEEGNVMEVDEEEEGVGAGIEDEPNEGEESLKDESDHDDDDDNEDESVMNEDSDESSDVDASISDHSISEVNSDSDSASSTPEQKLKPILTKRKRFAPVLERSKKKKVVSFAPHPAGTKHSRLQSQPQPHAKLPPPKKTHTNPKQSYPRPLKAPRNVKKQRR